MDVIILRGLPGSGKTTWVENYRKSLQPARRGGEFEICSADNCHINFATGKYEYKPENAILAHNYCLHLFLQSLMRGSNDPLKTVVVDNTNCAAWEISPYFRIAEINGIKPRLVRLHVTFEVAVARNIHNVPASTIWAMTQKLIKDELPPWWKEEIILGM